MTTSNKKIIVRDLTVQYEGRAVIVDVDVEIAAGQIVGVLGPNGAGKSTFFKGLLQLCPRVSGYVRFMGETLEQMRGKIAYVGQRSLIDWDFPITASQVVQMGSYSRLGWFKRTSLQEKKRASETLERLGLSQYADRQISELSGGQQQRLFLGRSLMQDADIYFLDEPFVGIDMTTEALIMDILSDLASKGKTILIIHHDLTRVKQYFNTLILLNRVVVAEGPTEKVYTQENLMRLFGQPSAFLDKVLQLSSKQLEGLE